MGAGYLADSNAIIDLVLNRLPPASAAWLDERIARQQVSLSVIARIELLTKTAPATEYTMMQAFVRSVQIFSLNEPVIQQTIQLR